jgi:hypothetical protein
VNGNKKRRAVDGGEARSLKRLQPPLRNKGFASVEAAGRIRMSIDLKLLHLEPLALA